MGFAKITEAYSFEDVLRLYTTNLVLVPADELDWYSDENKKGVAGYFLTTAMIFFMLLMYADQPAGTYLVNDSGASWDLGSQVPSMNDQIMSSGSTMGLVRLVLFPWSIPDTGGNWEDVNPGPYGEVYTGDGFEPHWEVYTQFMEAFAGAIDGNTIRSMTSKAERVFSQHSDTLDKMEEFFISPFKYPVVVRYPFRVLPPAYDYASLVGGIIFLAAVAVVAITVSAITAVRVRTWRQKQQAKIQAQTEKAWAAMTNSPSPENVQAYRKACLKQNTIGKIFGCSSVSNTNYWGGSDDETANPDNSSIVTLITGEK